MSARNSLTDHQKKRYVQEGGQTCPYCTSDNIEAGRYEADTSVAWTTVTCLACGNAWRELYQLIAIESI